jgi:MFS family permease
LEIIARFLINCKGFFVTDSDQPPKLAYEPPDDERPASAAVPPPQVLEKESIHDPYAALRYRDFGLYLVGWFVSVIGSQVLEVAVAWDLYQRTHNALTLGWVGLVAAAPIILLALPAGQIADHVDRRRIMVSMQTLAIACAVGLGILSLSPSPLWLIYGILFMAAVAKAIGWPARTALVPSLVPPEVFPNAIAWNTTAFETAAMAGPALGGFLIAWNHTVPYFVTATCGLIFIATIIPIRKRPQSSRREPPSLKSLAAGIRFVIDNQIILAIITLDLFAVLLGGATYILPIFAKDILNVGAHGFGWLRASPALGAILCALLVAHLPPMKRAGRALLLAVTGFGIASIIFGLSRSFWLSMAMLFLTGAFDNISVFVRHTLVQSLTPDSMRGRVSAVNNIFVGASNELGGFESGLTARFFGPVISVVGGGIGTLVVVSLTTFVWPQVRKFGSLTEARPIEEKITAAN